MRSIYSTKSIAFGQENSLTEINAVIFSNENGCVRVKATQSNDFIKIVVSDEGIDIAAVDHDKLSLSAR
ncbi:ATP-binding protein [Methanosarcina sp. WWM596]|uniref:ATP-binding protein n=1 Tax=Methanosarcina sp. WWM596 TaxID=1434103 RepID=UPI000615D7E7|nr:ATP-binding protein [Methanosarcina sp. WWM596]AKB18016.1 hypothetical protein MSWHS_1153 [Methanosarcina sp. WWM596]